MHSQTWSNDRIYISNWLKMIATSLNVDETWNRIIREPRSVMEFHKLFTDRLQLYREMSACAQWLGYNAITNNKCMQPWNCQLRSMRSHGRSMVTMCRSQLRVREQGAASQRQAVCLYPYIAQTCSKGRSCMNMDPHNATAGELFSQVQFLQIS